MALALPASEISTAFHFKYEFRVDEVAKVAKVNHNKIYSTLNGVIVGAAKIAYLLNDSVFKTTTKQKTWNYLAWWKVNSVANSQKYK